MLLTRPCWIFDLDGTLTRPVHDFAAIREALGVPPNQGILEYIDTQPPPLKITLQRRLADIERALAERAQPNEGAVALVEQLSRRGCRLAIFTRNRRDCVQISLQRLGIDGLFDPACIQACDDGPPKPDPQGIHALLNHWQSPAEQCLIVGDYLYDLQAGKRANIGTIHYRGQATPERSWPALTDLSVSSFAELSALLANVTRPA